MQKILNNQSISKQQYTRSITINNFKLYHGAIVPQSQPGVSLKTDSCTSEVEQRGLEINPHSQQSPQSLTKLSNTDIGEETIKIGTVKNRKNETKRTHSVENPVGQRPLCKTRNSGHAKGNTGKTLQVIGTGKGFLKRNPSSFSRIGKWNCMKLKTSTQQRKQLQGEKAFKTGRNCSF